jgi:glycosyltransferase involved in cell wall biosynthesis
VETLLEVARAFINEPAYAFLIIGRGDRYHAIQSIIDKEGLTNCQLMPFQPDAEIQNSLSAADLAVVILDEKVASSSIPSKTYNLLAVGAAFMVIGSEQAELAGFVKDYQVGQSFSQSDLQGMIEYIRQLKNDPALLLQYKANALKTAEQFTYHNAGKYLQHYLDSN